MKLSKDDYLSLSQAAKELDCGIGALRKRIKRGTLEPHFVIGKYALTRSQIEQLREGGFVKRNRAPR
jgi:hypothetical protein